MRPRLPLFAPANRRKPKPDPAPAYPPEPTVHAPATPTTPPPINDYDQLNTATRYAHTDRLPAQTRELGAAWLASEAARLADLAALGGDHTAHQTIHTATKGTR